MKRLLAFLFSLLPVLAWGANPSFDSFRQTNSGFIVNQPYIYVANTNTGGTNVIINGDVIYTNTTISYFVTTNFYDQSTIIITNSTVTITNSTVTINGTNVATINPTIGRIPFKFSDFQFGDSALYHIDTNTVGTTDLETGIVGVSNLVSGGFVISVDSGLGYGYLTNAPFSDFGLWTNIYGYLQPTDLTQPLFWTNSVTWGPGTTNAVFRSGKLLVYTNSSTSGTYPGIEVREGNGQRARFLSGGNLATVQGEAGVSLLDNITTPNEVRWFAHYFAPNDNSSQLGGDEFVTEKPFYRVNSWTNLVWGFFGATTVDYSRLAISHTGTNGAVVFDSQAAGSAGAGRPIEFSIDGTPYGYLNNLNAAWGRNAMSGLIAAGSGSGANTAIGANAGFALNSGVNDTLIGYFAGVAYDGRDSVMIGTESGLHTASGDKNTYIGQGTARFNTNGASSVAIGANTGSHYTNLVQSVVIGNQDLQTGDNTHSLIDSVWIGYKSATTNSYPANLTNVVVIGKDVIPTGNNQAFVGNPSTTMLWVGNVGWFQGSGTPEGAVTAPVGSFYSNTSGGVGTSFYVKESGSGNTGWQPK